jgi:hypothetical protein
MGVENEREKISWSRPTRASSMGMHGVPCSSSTVRIITTEKRSRIRTGSARLRSRMERMPMVLRRLVIRAATPQISTTESLAISASCCSRGTESQRQTPPNAGLCLAHWLASFARVLVRAIPTQTGTPTFRATAALMVRPSPSRCSGVPLTPRKASSML